MPRESLRVDQRAVNQVAPGKCPPTCHPNRETTCDSPSTRPARLWRDAVLQSHFEHPHFIISVPRASFSDRAKSRSVWRFRRLLLPFLKQCAGRTNIHTLAAAGASIQITPRLIKVRKDAAVDTPVPNVPGVRALDLGADAHAARAQDAAVLVYPKQLVREVNRSPSGFR